MAKTEGRLIANNKKAYHEYFILEKYEAQSDQGEFCFTNIYDTRTNQKQSYESRCKVKGNIVVLY